MPLFFSFYSFTLAAFIAFALVALLGTQTTGMSAPRLRLHEPKYIAPKTEIPGLGNIKIHIPDTKFAHTTKMTITQPHWWFPDTIAATWSIGQPLFHDDQSRCMRDMQVSFTANGKPFVMRGAAMVSEDEPFLWLATVQSDDEVICTVFMSEVHCE